MLSQILFLANSCCGSCLVLGQTPGHNFPKLWFCSEVVQSSKTFLRLIPCLATQIQSLQVEQPAVPGPLRIVITSPSQTAADGNPCQSPIIAASRGSKSDGNSKSNNSGRAENAWCSSPLEAALLQHAQGRLHAAVKGPLGAGSIGLIHRQGLRELLPWQRCAHSSVAAILNPCDKIPAASSDEMLRWPTNLALVRIGSTMVYPEGVVLLS